MVRCTCKYMSIVAYTAKLGFSLSLAFFDEK